jgi:hypothetical protein
VNLNIAQKANSALSSEVALFCLVLLYRLQKCGIETALVNQT